MLPLYDIVAERVGHHFLVAADSVMGVDELETRRVFFHEVDSSLASLEGLGGGEERSLEGGEELVVPGAVGGVQGAGGSRPGHREALLVAVLDTVDPDLLQTRLHSEISRNRYD